MASYSQRQRPMSISAIDIDIHDIESSSSENYRQRHNFEETVSSDLTKVNTRWCLITLILVLVVITLLSIAGLIIAIYSLALSTKNSSIILVTAATYSTTVNTTTSAVICSSSPTTSYTYSTATPPQCLNYTVNTDETRNIAYTNTITACDNVSPFSNGTSVWIRFEDPAGKVVANSPVPPNYCGTVATGWYAGQYPAAVFSTATSIVCFYQSTNTCAGCSLISVTNCQNFYVFLLPEPQSCNYRYCTL